MELKINDYQVPQEISFNFEEIKNEISERVSYYKDLVYTDAEIKSAKADRAKLRKVIDAIDSQRKKVKADLLQPYTELEAKLDEIKGIIQEPINMIDVQIKAYEELQKEQKTESIMQEWTDRGAEFSVEVIWNPKWLNTTYSMKKITDEMDEAIAKYENGLETLNRMGDYAFEGIEMFKKTLDLGQAMVHVNDLKEQAKRKAEYEAGRQKLEAEMAEAREKQTHVSRELDPIAPQETVAPEARKWITFSANLTYRQALDLEQFFNMRNIEFRKGE